MSNGAVISANRGPVAGFLFSQGGSPFEPRPWRTVANFSTDIVSYTPSTTAQWGSTTLFDISNNSASYFGKIIFEFTLDAPTIAPAGAGSPDAGTGQRYDDFVAYSALRQCRLRYGTNDVDILTGEDIKFKFYDERYDEYKREALINEVHGPKSIAQREADFASGITCRVEIPWYFTRALSSALPQVFGSQMTFAFDWANLNEVLQNSVGYTGNVNISGQRLYIEHIHVSSQEKAALQLGAANGLLYLQDRIQTNTIQPSALAAGSQIVPHELRTFNVDTTYIKILCRLQSQLSTAFNIDRWTIRGDKQDPDFVLQAVGLVQGGNTIVRTTVDRSILKPFAWSWTRTGPGILDNNIDIDFSKHPLSSTDHFGSLNFGAMNNPALQYTLVSVAGGQVLNLKAMATVKNVINAKKGSLWSTFN